MGELEAQLEIYEKVLNLLIKDKWENWKKILKIKIY